AGFVAWFQLREAAKTRYLEALIRMFDDFGSREAYFEADALLGLPQRIEDFSPAEIGLASWSVRIYEKIGFLVDTGLIPEDLIVPLYSRRILWSWDALQPYIKQQRELRDNGGAYRMAGDGLYFERLYQRALAYRRRHYRGQRANPPVPAAYRERLQQILASGQAAWMRPEAGGGAST
ncbi:MAG: hypothetical protein IVW57_10250, partial [Ktedonobacterales bacterium]|nr:hypothetical protein [Ktedonobacterales bacterium]